MPQGFEARGVSRFIKGVTHHIFDDAHPLAKSVEISIKNPLDARFSPTPLCRRFQATEGAK